MTHGPMPASQRAAISAGHARNRAGNSLLYVAVCHGGETVKIGCSIDPEARLRSWGITPNVIARVKGGYGDESCPHKQIRAYRNRRGHEWYDAAVLAHPAVVAVFGQLKASA